MNVDPRAPVIVGAAQCERHPKPEELADMAEPVDMMAEALRQAGADSGGRGLLEAASCIDVVLPLSWHYRNPALLLAERLGTTVPETAVTTTGGNSPQALVTRAASRIASGQADVVLIAGAEAVWTRLAARRQANRTWLPWTDQPEATPAPLVLGNDRDPLHPAESARSLALPIQIYPLFENALRAASRRSIGEHQDLVSQLWSRFSAVAASNPHAWSHHGWSPEEIRAATPENRMICFPYPKRMNANIQTDQAAALVVCSLEAARSAGVADDRLVFVHSGADAEDHWFVSERADLHSSPAIRLAGRDALGSAGVGIDDVAHVDLYSCFPSAVQIAAAELGLGLDEADRPLTVTGGLAFAGGPGNNYVTHSIAAMVDVLRRHPGSFGLVTGVGWFLTKHAVGVYSTRAPKRPFGAGSPQSRVDELPAREVVATHKGPVTVETYTVAYERDGSPNRAVMACLLPGGGRAWGASEDPDVLASLVTEEGCGRPGSLAADGVVTLS